jgi:hypothetical protein
VLEDFSCLYSIAQRCALLSAVCAHHCLCRSLFGRSAICSLLSSNLWLWCSARTPMGLQHSARLGLCCTDVKCADNVVCSVVALMMRCARFALRSQAATVMSQFGVLWCNCVSTGSTSSECELCSRASRLFVCCGVCDIDVSDEGCALNRL